MEGIAHWAIIPPQDIALLVIAIRRGGLLMRRLTRHALLVRTKTEIIVQKAMAAADGLLRFVSPQIVDAHPSSIRTQPSAAQQKEALRLQRFSQCSRRVCFALCDDYCERVFAPWQNCGINELAQESRERRSESSHS